MKYVYIISGFISLFFGLIAAIAPILPAFLFIIFAAFCFARGSERFHTWLVTHRWFGPMIKYYHEKGVTLPVRLTMVGFVTVWVSISIYFLPNLFLDIALIAIWAILSLTILAVHKRKHPVE